MSFLSSLFRRPSESFLKQGTSARIPSSLRRALIRGKGEKIKKSYLQKREMREYEKLEHRLALSVTVIERPNLLEENFSGQPLSDPHPGQLVVASDQGSDVFIQQVDITPSELLVADNGSFLDYMAIENVEENFDEFIVTNGSQHQQQESITADSWWLFPTKTNDNAVSVTEDEVSTENLTTTRLALDRPEVVIGPYTENSGTGAEDGSGRVVWWRHNCGSYSGWKLPCCGHRTY